MPEDGFTEHRINWSQLKDFIKRDWIYRGQECSTWGLQTSLERLCSRLQVVPDKGRNVETNLLREFRRRFHHYATHIPKSTYNLEWLSLMQHHGAPTRLLDFTYSMHVAAYFALEKASGDCCIWAIDSKWVNRQAAEVYNKGSRSTEWLFDRVEDEVLEVQYAEMVLREPAIPAVFSINPFALNERLTIQKGVFLCQGDANTGFEKNLEALEGYKNENHVVKLVLSGDERQKALHELYHMNIGRSTLFPGLDGFAQSLNVYHPAIGFYDRNSGI